MAKNIFHREISNHPGYITTINKFGISSSEESQLQIAIDLLTSGDFDGAIGGFLEVLFCINQSTIAPFFELKETRPGSSDLWQKAVTGLTEAVLGASRRIILPLIESSGSFAREKNNNNSSPDKPTDISFQEAYGDDEEILSIEKLPALMALFRMLKLMNDSSIRQCAILRLCKVMSARASEKLNESKSTLSPPLQTGNKQQEQISPKTMKEKGDVDLSTGLRDLAVIVATFNVMLKALPNTSAALPVLNSLCVLGKNLALLGLRRRDAVTVLRIPLGYAVCNVPILISNVDYALEKKGQFATKHSSKPTLELQQSHSDYWTMALKILISIAKYSAEVGCRDETLAIYRVVLEYEATNVPALDGITDIAIYSTINEGENQEFQAMDIPKFLKTRAVSTLLSVISYDQRCTKAWNALLSLARRWMIQKVRYCSEKVVL